MFVFEERENGSFLCFVFVFCLCVCVSSFWLLGLRPGGALRYFGGRYVPPGTPNWHPVLKKIPPKIDTPF